MKPSLRNPSGRRSSRPGRPSILCCYGRPISVEFRPSLWVARHRFVEPSAARASAVEAASFLRRRRMVLDAGLLGEPAELSRIFVHELFHFAWLRLSNAARRAWERILEREWRRHARGELGWSAEWRKRELTAADLAGRSRRWREYCCESFCDTAAYGYSGLARHPEFSLAAGHADERLRWFAARFPSNLVRI